jgi:ribosomal protein L11 methyltransferase
MAWHGVRVTVPVGHLDRLTGSRASVVRGVRATDDAVVLEPAPGETPMWPLVRLDALFDADVDIASVAKAISADCVECDEDEEVPAVAVRRVDDADWSNTWRQFAGPLTFGGRLTVVPRDWSGPIEGVALRLDPGLAFGTGTHPTTALCLDWLAHHDLTGWSVVDYGCGSGILAIAALCLGAARVDAVDYDPQARLATWDNAAYNDDVDGLRQRLRVLAPEDVANEAHDLVLANILADPLVALAPRLAALVRVGGRIVLSGVRVDQLERVLLAYPAFSFSEPEFRDGWVAIEGTRTGA